MNQEHLDLCNLTPSCSIEAFDCAEDDLNEFLKEESNDYQDELLAKTYLLMNAENGDVVAYYSLLNDVIRLENTEKSIRNRINRKIPFNKQRNHYPAVKVGRLAVDKSYAHQGIGRLILDSAKGIEETIKILAACRLELLPLEGEERAEKALAKLVADGITAK